MLHILVYIYYIYIYTVTLVHAHLLRKLCNITSGQYTQLVLKTSITSHASSLVLLPSTHVIRVYILCFHVDLCQLNGQHDKKIKSLQFAKDSRDIVNLYSIFYSCARNADKFASKLFIFYITHIFMHTNINIPFLSL